jgi:hypothetical protein
MQKIVICPDNYFELTQEMVEWLYNEGHELTIGVMDKLLEKYPTSKEYSNIPLMPDREYHEAIDRDDVLLVQCIEMLGASDRWKVIEIPDGVKWKVMYECDGEGEWVAEEHRTWR